MKNITFSADEKLIEKPG